MPKVSIEKVERDNPKKAVYKSLDSLQILPKKKIEKILIKPNLCHYYSPDTGITTDPRVVSSIIDYVRDKISADAKITIGEADATEMKADIAFKVLGYEKLAEEKKVLLLNLSKDKRKKVPGKFVKEVPLTINDCDLLITVPKLKTHMDLKISICLKNQFGAIPYGRKILFHKHLEETIIEASKFMRPNLCVVDGIIALERKGPISEGLPIKMNLIIGGDDPVATDHVCSQIMGFPKVKYVMMAEKQNIGSTNNIQIYGEKIGNVKTKFRFVTPRERMFTQAQSIFNIIRKKR